MDLLRYVLDRIHEECKYQVPLLGDASGASSSSPLRRSQRLQRQGTAGSSNFTHPSDVPKAKRVHQSIITETFSGRLSSSIQCLKCDRVSVCVDPFWDLSLPIAEPKSASSAVGVHSGQAPGANRSTSPLLNGILSFGDSLLGTSTARPVPLESCLATFCEPETLDGKERYRCEHCKTLVPCVKRLGIVQLPNVQPLLFIFAGFVHPIETFSTRFLPLQQTEHYGDVSLGRPHPAASFSGEFRASFGRFSPFIRSHCSHQP